MSNYSDKAEDVKKYASLLFSVAEISIATDIPQDELRVLISSKGNPIYDAFHEGKLTTKIKVNNSLIELAQNGSQPAINKVLQKLNELDYDADEE